MLELRPGCEHCDRDLPPEATDARICSFECTFCVNCVETVLENVCPNCGGAFEKRPIRPRLDHFGPHTGNRPPATERKHKPVDVEKHRALVASIKLLPAHER